MKAAPAMLVAASFCLAACAGKDGTEPPPRAPLPSPPPPETFPPAFLSVKCCRMESEGSQLPPDAEWSARIITARPLVFSTVPGEPLAATEDGGPSIRGDFNACFVDSLGPHPAVAGAYVVSDRPFALIPGRAGVMRDVRPPMMFSWRDRQVVFHLLADGAGDKLPFAPPLRYTVMPGP